MKHIKLFENFKFGNDLKSLIETIKDHIKDDSFKVKPEFKSDKITLSEGENKMEIYDNDQDNDFFLVKLFKKNKIIQDFKKNDQKDGYSPDEMPTENILILISIYFQNK